MRGHPVVARGHGGYSGGIHMRQWAWRLQSLRWQDPNAAGAWRLRLRDVEIGMVLAVARWWDLYVVVDRQPLVRTLMSPRGG